MMRVVLVASTLSLLIALVEVHVQPPLATVTRQIATPVGLMFLAIGVLVRRPGWSKLSFAAIALLLVAVLGMQAYQVLGR